MTAADTAVRASLHHATAAVCTHCRLPVPAGLIEPDAGDQFCCGGCRTAFAVIHDHGLDTYDDTTVGRDGPVAAEPRGRSFEEFDHATLPRALRSPHAGGARAGRPVPRGCALRGVRVARRARAAGRPGCRAGRAECPALARACGVGRHRRVPLARRAGRSIRLATTRIRSAVSGWKPCAAARTGRCWRASAWPGPLRRT